MWTYIQTTGHIIDPHDRLLGTGYSGLAGDKNDPADQGIQGCGPIPQGEWNIGDAEDSPTLGPIAMPLTPAAGTDTLGRSGFYIHGDSIQHPGSASHGCMILARDIRAQIALSSDRLLNVEP